MKVFVFDPASQQKLKAFNEELVAFCDEEAVIDISGQMYNNKVVVSCVTADDVMAVPGQTVMVAMVRPVPDEDLGDYLNGILDSFDGEEEEGPVPVKVQLLEKTSGKGGFGLFICINGVIDPDAEGDDGEDDDEDDEGGDEGVVPEVVPPSEMVQ